MKANVVYRVEYVSGTLIAYVTVRDGLVRTQWNGGGAWELDDDGLALILFPAQFNARVFEEQIHAYN
jgi:hypothetical protein